MSGLLTSALGSDTRPSYVTLPPPLFSQGLRPSFCQMGRNRLALHSVGWERMSAKRR